MQAGQSPSLCYHLLMRYRRIQTASLWVTAAAGYLYLVGSLDDEEDEVEVTKSVKQAAAVATKKETLGPDEVEGDNIEEQGEQVEDEGGEGEEEITVPEQAPEGAWFIPLGWARECPPSFYKGHDPEWQSFVEFSQDRQRSLLVRSLLLLSTAVNLIVSNALIDELAGLVGQHMSGLKPVQNFLGQPVKIGKYWLDIDFPEGPPPEYERAGYDGLTLVLRKKQLTKY